MTDRPARDPHLTMPHLRVKVCGLTRPDEARVAVAAGADAIGLVHHPASPRHVDVELAATITRAVGARALTVAVLVDVAPDAALDWATRAGTSAVQLCGHEDPADFCDFPLPLLRIVRVDATGADEQDAWAGTAALYVLDHPGGHGGTGGGPPGGSGRSVQVDIAARLAARARCLLAGGLAAANVGDAVRAVRPVGVDASSKLESVPGRKSPSEVRAFVRQARAALDGVHS